MHNAPSVTYPVGRSFLLVALLSGLALLSASLAAFWVVTAGRLGAPQLLMLLGWLAAAFVAGRCWQQRAQGELQWDGQTWLWRSGAAMCSGQVAVRLDWQRWLLLALLDESGRTHWLWLMRGADARRWPALRRALYAAPARVGSAVAAGDLAL